MTPQQLAEQQRQQDALNEWEREDAIRKTTMKTLLLFLWTNRHALAALIIKTLEAKLKEEEQRLNPGPEPTYPMPGQARFPGTGFGNADWPTVPPNVPDEIKRLFTQAPVSNPVIPTTGIGPIIEPWKPATASETTDGPGGENRPTVHDTASAILEAKK